MSRKLIGALCGLAAVWCSGSLFAETPAERIKTVIAAAGGEEKLLKLFQFRERVIIGSTPPPALKEDEPGNRTSVVEIPDHWWVGKDKRDKDKVRVLVWAWTLRILTDPKSKVELLEDSTVLDTKVSGLRVTGSIQEPLELYFDKTDHRLTAIDYTDTRHVFSEWKKTPDGIAYPSRVVGYRFADKAKRTLQEKQWYQTDLLELTPLKELPEGLVR